MYAVVSRCKVDQKHYDALASSVQKNPKTPNPKGHKGVKHYYFVDVAPGEWATIMLFENEKAADEWRKHVSEFTKHNDVKKVRGEKAVSGRIVHAVSN